MAGLLKKLKQDYTLNPTKGSNKVVDTIKGLADWEQVGEDARNIGFGALDFASLWLMPALPLFTGKTATDFLETAGVETYKGDLGKKLAKGSDIVGNTYQMLAPVAAGLVGQSFGVPYPVGSAVGSAVSGLGGLATKDIEGATERFEEEEQKKSQKQLDMYKFKSGGLTQHRIMNVEKGELLVNPNTLEIIEEFKDVPKHPEGKYEVDIRGYKSLPVGMAIIPVKYAEEFKKGDEKKRREIINKLPGFSNIKAQTGLNDEQPLNLGSNVPDGGVPIDLGENVGAFGYVGKQNNPYFTEDDYLKLMTLKSVPNATSTTQNTATDPLSVAAITAPSMGLGLYQAIAANKALKKLAKEPYAMYDEKTQPEMEEAYKSALSRASDAALRSRYGLSEEQKAIFGQNIARDINTRMQRAQDIGGGNVGQVIANIMNANRIQAAQQQAELDARLQEQKRQYAERLAQYAEGLAQRIANMRQMQQNRNVAFEQDLRLQKERAYGLAKQRGLQNAINAALQAALLYNLGK